MTDLHKIVAAICPEAYCESNVSKEVQMIVQAALARGDKDAYLQGAKIAKLKECRPINYYMTYYGDTLNYKEPYKEPIEKHKLTYNAFGESLEPIYFWIRDVMETSGYGGFVKLVDNFVSSPGSGHFSEMGAKRTRMQEEAMKILGAVNQVIKSILNIIYDLKEFNIRLKIYDEINSKDKEVKRAAYFGLKQIWMDSVDAKRGTTSLKGLAQQFDYVTIIDAFMSAQDLEELKEINLNERVRRILQQRVADFLRWIKESERELRKRYEIEKAYLRSQYSTVQLYARWVRPYLESARKLEERAEETDGLVTAFNTTLLELTLLARRGFKPEDEIRKSNLPENFRGTNKKNYTPITIIELRFRSFPEKFGQNYGFRGRADITFTSYALNDQEVKVLKDQLDRDSFGDLLEVILGTTTESLGQIKEDIDFFLYDKKPKKEEEEEEKGIYEDINPFTSLFSFLGTGKKNKKEEKPKSKIALPPDSDTDKIIRGRCIYESRRWCVKFYEAFKKGHKMAAFSPLEDAF